MRKIYKYTLEFEDLQQVNLLEGSKILSIQAQDNKPQLWAEVSDSESMKAVNIMCYGTGHMFRHEQAENYIYVGTLQFGRGQFVFHYYVQLDRRNEIGLS